MGRVCVRYLNEALGSERHDGVELVRLHGFDIEQTSKWLRGFLLLRLKVGSSDNDGRKEVQCNTTKMCYGVCS